MAWAEGQRDVGKRMGHTESPQDGVRPTTCSALTELACVEAISTVRCCQSNSKRFHIKLWIAGFSRKLSSLVSPTQTPARMQLASCEGQYHPFTSLTRDQWAVPCGIVCAPLGCLCFFSNRKEESETLSISVFLLKMGKQELLREAARSPGCPFPWLPWSLTLLPAWR